MKARAKSIVMAMALCFIMALTACGKNETISNESTENAPDDSVQSKETSEQAGSGSWLAGQRFSGSVSDEELQSWIDGQEPSPLLPPRKTR